MIFVGDVAILEGEVFEGRNFPSEFSLLPICLNLEGPISLSGTALGWGVVNAANWLSSFPGNAAKVAFIGNNHISDLDNGIVDTQRWLSDAGISSFGAGANEAAARAAVRCASGAETYTLLGAGWPVIGCKPASAQSPGVNPLDATFLREEVRRLSGEARGTRVVVVLHWNYEFERYPQPAHRKLAMNLIDAGAYAVIGHHPHIVGPMERYKGRTIAYSLGNWAFSYGRHFAGRLRFPPSSFHQIAIELGRTKDIVHHTQFVPPVYIEYSFSEDISSDKFSLKPEFEGLSHKEYITLFKKKRIKRKLLPIYKNPEQGISNAFRDFWVAKRQKIIDTAAKTGIKRMHRK